MMGDKKTLEERNYRGKGPLEGYKGREGKYKGIEWGHCKKTTLKLTEATWKNRGGGKNDKMPKTWGQHHTSKRIARAEGCMGGHSTEKNLILRGEQQHHRGGGGGIKESTAT